MRGFVRSVLVAAVVWSAVVTSVAAAPAADRPPPGRGAAAAPERAAAEALGAALVARGQAPKCVKIKHVRVTGGRKAYKVKNSCATTKRLRGLFKHGSDSACKRVKPGRAAYLASAQRSAAYDKVVTC